MIGYAARTTTARNRAFLARNGWRLMISAAESLGSFEMPYALDNGAWKTFRNHVEFDADRFRRACDRVGEGADFIVAPDIVSGGFASLDRSLLWLDYCLARCRLVLIPVQEGMHVDHLAPFLCSSIGLFIGGQDDFKEGTLDDWADLAYRHSAYIHCGRVNSLRRILLCQQAGVDSFDGSGPAKFLKHAKVMDRGLRQSALVWRGNLNERTESPTSPAEIRALPAKQR